MAKKQWFVYMHIAPNNKKYIGITSQTQPEKRWGKNGYYYQSSTLFWRAIQKYGWDNITHKILFSDLSGEEAKAKEIELIKRYQSNNTKFGYNITAGGDGATGVPFSFEAQEKRGTCKSVVQLNKDGTFVATHYNIHQAALAVDGNFSHISSCCNGRFSRKSVAGFLWMFYNDFIVWDGSLSAYYDRFETELIIHGKAPPKIKLRPIIGIAVDAYDSAGILIGRYNQIKEAMIAMDVSYEAIKQSCDNKTAMRCGTSWRYQGDSFVAYSPVKQGPQKKRVAQYTTDGKFLALFDGVQEASDKVKINLSSISNCITNKQKTAGGYIWQLTDGSSSNLDADVIQLHKNNTIKPINQYTLEGNLIAHYPSICEAGRCAGVDDACIVSVLKGRQKTAGNYLWQYA